MIRSLQYIKASNTKRFLFSILVISLFSSTISYATYNEFITNPDRGQVDSYHRDNKTVNYDEALQIAFSNRYTTYSKYQVRIYNLHINIAQTTYAQHYIIHSRKGFYIRTTLDYTEEEFFQASLS